MEFMNRWIAVVTAVVVALFAPSSDTGTAKAVPGVAAASVSALASHALPFDIAFESNRGQAPAGTEFFSRGPGYSIHLSGTQAAIVLAPPVARAAGPARVADPGVQPVTPQVVRMSLLGASPRARGEARDMLPGKSHYFTGRDRRDWRTGIDRHAKVRYAGVYPGIDLEYYGRQGQLEFDFVLAPGANPERIALAFDGARGIRIDDDGNLRLATARGDLVQHKPVAYQVIDGRRREVAAAFVLPGDNRVQFALGPYDRSQQLVVDPVLQYGSYFGGDGEDWAYAIDVDKSGNTYIAGSTTSADVPFDLPSFGQRQGYDDAFVCKLRRGGAALAYCAFIGGSNGDTALAMKVDAGGRVVLAGATSSTDFPLVNPSQATYGQGARDGFVARLSADGSALTAGTYLGGNQEDLVLALALDPVGNAYVAGRTWSGSGIATSGTYDTSPGASGSDAFVAKYAVSGARLYGTYLGGDAEDHARAIAVDAQGNAYVAGGTRSADFPLKSAVQGTLHGTEDGFVAKFAPSGKALVYSTYLSAGPAVPAVSTSGLAIDAGGRAYAFTWTRLVGLSPDGTNLILDRDVVINNGAGDAALAIDPVGNIVLAATADDARGTLETPLGGSPFRGVLDAVVARFSPTGRLLYSSYYGSTDADDVGGIAVDRAGTIHLAGRTHGTDLTVAAPFQAKAVLPPAQPAPAPLPHNAYIAMFAPAQSAWAGDFNGDGRSDVFLRNRSSGANAIWRSANASLPMPVATIANQDWQPAGVGDFDGDHRDDLLWRNPVTGQNLIWRSANRQTATQVAYAGGNWRAAAIGDFDGDGMDDIFWRNASYGTNAIWRSARSATQVAVPAVSNLAWEVVGAGDFDADGRDDVVWRDSATGANVIWKSGNASTQLAVLPLADPLWRVAGTGDYDGDQHADLLWRHMATGRLNLWKAAIAGAQMPLGVQPLAWEMSGQGDYDGDGHADVLWHNNATRQNSYWRSANPAQVLPIASTAIYDWDLVL